jgi:phosphoribosylformylglycinamidine synthase
VHDISEGGIACAAVEMALASGLSVSLNLDDPAYGDFAGTYPAWPALLFGEDQARYLLSLPASTISAVIALAKAADVRITSDMPGDQHPLGFLSAEPENIVSLREEEFGNELEVSLATLRAAHEGWLPRYMTGGE